MLCYCPFNEDSTISKVDQFGFVNINDAIANGVVSGTVDVDDSSYNDIYEPSTIVGKPSDCFEAIRMQSAALDRGKVVTPSGDSSV